MEHAPTPPPPPPIKGGSGRILLVDDDRMIRASISRMLNRFGYECVTAEEGAKACALYVEARTESRPFAAVLLDATIPGGLGGEAALHLILQADPDARVILFSGYADSDVMARALELGFKARLAKPFDRMQLAAVMSEVLA